MISKFKTKSIIGVWGFLLALSIVSRPNSTLLFRTSGIELSLLIITMIAVIITNANHLLKRQILISDIFFAIYPILFLRSEEISKYIIFVLICIIFYYLIQNEYMEIKYIMYPLLAFAILTSVVTWVSYFAPKYYIQNILPFFPEASSLQYSFLNRNMYSGFTNHYSRNSFYISVGVLLMFSSIICEKKQNIGNWILIIFFMCTEFLVAKRGPTLFLLLSLFIVIVKMERDISRKIKKSIKFILLGIGIFILAFLFVPGIDNIIYRILSPNSDGDISSSRFYLWKVAWNMFKEAPIVGKGWGSYLTAMNGTTFQGAHNDYFQVLAENGLIGFIICVVTNLVNLYYSSRTFEFINRDRFGEIQEQKWVVFSFVFQIFFILYSMTGLPHYSYEQFGLYIILCGFSIGIYKSRVMYETDI